MLSSIFDPAGFRRYLANTSWLFVEHVVSRLIALFLSIYVARYLGPDQFGLLNYALSLVGLFSLIATLGLDEIVIRELVHDETDRDRLLGTAWVLKLLGALLLIGVLLVVIWATSHGATTDAMVLLIASGTLFQSFHVIDFYFRSRVESKYVALAKLGSSVLNLALTVCLVVSDAGVTWFAVLVSVNSLALSIGLILFYGLRRLRLTRWRFAGDLALSLLKESWPLALSLAVVSIYIHVDKVIIQNLLGSTATGEYAVASRLSEVWYFLPTVIVSSLFPAIINAKRSSEAHYYRRLQNLYDLMVWMSIGIAIPIAVLSHRIVGLFYGADYSNAGSVLAIHVWTNVFVFVGVASGRWMIIEGYVRNYFFRSLGGVAVNVGLNFWLIPRYGINGAAIATLVAQFFVVIVFDALSRDTRISFRMKMKAYLPLHLLRS